MAARPQIGIAGQIGEWFASEVISQKGVRVLFHALHNVQRTENVALMEKLVGVVIGILTILLQFEAGIVWTEKEMVLDEDVLESLLSILFGKMRSKPAVVAAAKAKADSKIDPALVSRDVPYSLNTRKLASAFLCTLLQQFLNDVPLALHKSFLRQPDLSARNYYAMMVDLASDDPLYNLALTVYLFLVDQDEMKQTVFKYFDAELGTAETSKWKKRANAPMSSKKMLIEDALLSSLRRRTYFHVQWTFYFRDGGSGWTVVIY